MVEVTGWFMAWYSLMVIMVHEFTKQVIKLAKKYNKSRGNVN